LDYIERLGYANENLFSSGLGYGVFGGRVSLVGWLSEKPGNHEGHVVRAGSRISAFRFMPR